MKTAVVYYSLEGNTKFAAEKIAEKLGADILSLSPLKPYPTGKASKYFVGGKSSVFQEKPVLSPYTFDPDAYDAIVIGTPLWAWNITPPVRTFLSENDLSGKPAAAFVCCGGGDPKKAFETIRQKCGSLLARQTFVNALKEREETLRKAEALCRALENMG